MKKQVRFIIFCLLYFKIVNAQNEMYIVTEKYDGIISSPPTFDSVYVTNPLGITTKYSIPSYITNQAGHDSQFNIILNGITSLGYKFIKPVQREGVSNGLLANPYCIIRTIYLAKSWSASVHELSKGNSKQITVKTFPNPTSTSLKLEIACVIGFEPDEVVIFNQLGYIIFSLPIKYVENNIVNLDVSSLKTGSYMLSVKNKTYYSEPRKIIIE